MANKGWIGVDFDGTLARYDGWKGPQHVGSPIPAMVGRVRAWLAEGRSVRIFTARVWHPEYGTVPDEEYDRRYVEADQALTAISQWCIEHIGQALPVTCEKDFGMIELWDDRCVPVVANTGEIKGSIESVARLVRNTLQTEREFVDSLLDGNHDLDTIRQSLAKWRNEHD